VTLLADITVVLTALYGVMILIFIIGMAKKQKKATARPVAVSVIIAARNEEQNIGRILADLAQQTYDPKLYEVIIADDHSTDGTARVVSEWAARHPFIKLLAIGAIPERFSPKKFAIQQAVESAKGDIILATDADCRVGPEWAAAMASRFEKNVGFVIGFSQFGAKGDKQNLIERLQAFDFVTLMGVACGSTNLGIPLAASGQNMGYRKSLFDQVGGYRKIAHRISGDDVLLLQLIVRHTRSRVVFAADPRAHAVSAPQPTLHTLINQRKRWASNGAYQLVLNPYFFMYLVLVLLFNAALLIGTPLALFSGKGLATIAWCAAARALIEGLISLRSAVLFKRSDLLKYFPLWFFCQIPYIVSVGLWGTFGRFSWKERIHSAQTV
jgi:cellulose synthase/poly-beta-1,6-N-acetylglucosamine synthase-like glycosyltransferase